ncbi:MAG: type II toxin-antitoxin system PemK/MazF family toxin [Polyangiaceae bacterium]|jgi:mRNA interferase MazF
MDDLARGDVVTVAATGDFAGKPRPAVVVQSDLFNETHASFTIVPITTALVDADLFRIDLRTKDSGLRARSQAMVDKITTVRRERIGRRIGALVSEDMDRIDLALRTWLSL